MAPKRNPPTPAQIAYVAQREAGQQQTAANAKAQEDNIKAQEKKLAECKTIHYNTCDEINNAQYWQQVQTTLTPSQRFYGPQREIREKVLGEKGNKIDEKFNDCVKNVLKLDYMNETKKDMICDNYFYTYLPINKYLPMDRHFKK